MTENTTSGRKMMADDKAFVEHINTWLNTKLELFKVSAIERMAVFSGSIALVAFLVFFGVITIAFVAVTLALLLAKWLDSTILGFAIVAMVYLVSFILLAFKGQIFIRETVVDWLVSELMNNDKEIDNENQ